MNKRQNWNVLGFRSWSMKGYIREELLVDLSGLEVELKMKVPQRNIDRKEKDLRPGDEAYCFLLNII